MTHLSFRDGCAFLGRRLDEEERRATRGWAACGARLVDDTVWSPLRMSVGREQYLPECDTCKVFVDQMLEMGGRPPKPDFIMRQRARVDSAMEKA